MGLLPTLAVKPQNSAITSGAFFFLETLATDWRSDCFIALPRLLNKMFTIHGKKYIIANPIVIHSSLTFLIACAVHYYYAIDAPVAFCCGVR